MKVAIITFSDFNTNYGSMLQAFSLKMFLEQHGHTVDFIKYREYNSTNYQLTNKEDFKNMVKKSILKLYRIIKKNDIDCTEKNFTDFKKKYFNYTPLYTTNDELKNKLEIYDCYICGSDQIWNINCLGGLRKPYFLDFAPEKKLKIAYAASLGDFKLTEKYKDDFKYLLNNLDYISVREKESVYDLQPLVDKKIVNVVDPVFLNSRDVWDKYLPEIKIKEPYAVCYFVRRSKFGKKIINECLKKYNIPIINLSDNLIYFKGTSSKFISSGPLEFISLIKNSSYTIGTSFHLAAFSILYDKPSLFIGLESNKSRILNILEVVNKTDSFIVEGSEYEKKIDDLFKQKTDLRAMDKFIEQSKLFLLESIGEENGKSKCNSSNI